jgi:hypothetical protein
MNSTLWSSRLESIAIHNVRCGACTLGFLLDSYDCVVTDVGIEVFEVFRSCSWLSVPAKE